MSYKTSLELAYHMGYEDALARRMPDADKVAVLLPDVADGVGEYITATDGHEGHWLTGEEIVRCRDCEHFTANDEFWIEPPFAPFPIIGATSDSCDFWAGTKCKVSPDGFCAWGKRKGGRMREFKWHKMADEQPTDERGKYLLIDKLGAMYLASGFHVWEYSKRKSFYIPNNRSGYMGFEKVEAWADAPEYGGDE